MTLWWEPSTTKRRKAFLWRLGCSWRPIAAPCRARRRMCLETCAKYLWKQCCRRHLPWSFQALFEVWLLGDQPDVLSPHHHSFFLPSAWQLEMFIRKNYRAGRMKPQMTGLGGGRKQWCVSPDSFYWNCLLFLFVIPLELLEREQQNQNSQQDDNRPGLKRAVWFVAWVGLGSCG